MDGPCVSGERTSHLAPDRDTMTNPLLLLCFPTLYVFGALFSLLQMQVIFTLIAKGVSQVKAISALEPVLPCEFPPAGA